MCALITRDRRSREGLAPIYLSRRSSASPQKLQSYEQPKREQASTVGDDVGDDVGSETVGESDGDWVGLVVGSDKVGK